MSIPTPKGLMTKQRSYTYEPVIGEGSDEINPKPEFQVVYDDHFAGHLESAP